MGEILLAQESEMLKGQAKTGYMREYMRRRRAAQPKPPKAKRKPTKAALSQIHYWAHSGGRCSRAGLEVLDFEWDG
jgi:hypothetical protein